MTSSRHPVRRGYEPAPVCHGGGFVFPELNDGIPWRTPEEWATLLDENDVQCEWPECDAIATIMMVVEQFTPFLCEMHRMGCVASAKARRIVKDHLTDKVLIISYGSPRSRGVKIPTELSEPYVPYDQRTTQPPAPKPKLPSQPVRVLSLPKLGQNRA